MLDHQITVGPARILVLTLAVLAAARPASAQWYLTGFLGNAATSPVRLSISAGSSDSALAIDAVELRDESSVSPWYYGWRVTKRFARARWLGVEAEFIHAKAISDAGQLVRIRGRLDAATVDDVQPLGTILPRFELSHGLNFVLGNVVFFWPIGTAKQPLFTIVGRFGAGPTVPHVEATFRGEDAYRYQFAGPAIGGAVGAHIQLLRHLGAVAEFKLTRTNQHLAVGSASIEGTFTTRHVFAGVTWHTTNHE